MLAYGPKAAFLERTQPLARLQAGSAPQLVARASKLSLACRRRRRRYVPSTVTSAASASAAAFPQGSGTLGQPGGNKLPPAPGRPDKLPWQQRILNGILNVSDVPYSSFVPYPVTPLHRVDATIKQLWLVALYVLIARATPGMRVGIAAAIALLTATSLPSRLWRAQLNRLALICALIFVFTAIGSDGVPPLLQPRALPDVLEGFAAGEGMLVPEEPYSYVVLHVGFLTITRRSINLAITAAALTFSALQAASLCLITTPGEEMAMALKRWLAPLQLLRVPTQQIAVTLLLSLRFMSLVFEEVRNLSLGVAARGIDWRQQGVGGSLQIFGRLVGRLFTNLFQRSEMIAQAMVVRGFLGPQRHHMYMMRSNQTSLLANATAVVLLVGLLAACKLG